VSEAFSHLDDQGRPRMVDVGAKPASDRRAVAAARIRFSQGVLARVLEGDLPKGPILDVARLAGIQAAKRTADLIPLCHPLSLTGVEVRIEPQLPDALRVEAEVRAHDRTGVEMEALCAAAVAALAVYDMVKAVDRGMVIEDLKLLAKEGGRSGTYEAGR
jgi:cyclic pyranopterin phosphate synthase